MKFGVAVKAIIKHNDKYLVIKKSSSEDVTPNNFDIPGGRLEFKEKPEEALHREVKEETGLKIDIIAPTRTWSFCPKDDFQLVGITFLCNLLDGELKLSDEHTLGEWHSYKEIIENNFFPDWLKEEFKAVIETNKRLLK